MPTANQPCLDALVISDIHLGSANCQAKYLCALLESVLDETVPAHRLIINGDVFDSIDFRRLKKTHWKVLSLIRHLSDKIEIVWTCGNHDVSAEIISHLLGVEVRDDYILESGGKRILILHGHVFDDFIDHHPLLTWVGDVAYNLLQRVDRTHYVARLAKTKSKTFLHCVDKVEKKAIALAGKRKCHAVLCGHTHQAAGNVTGDIHYFNSGCWTELPVTYLEVVGGAVRLRRYEVPAAAVETNLAWTPN